MEKIRNLLPEKLRQDDKLWEMIVYVFFGALTTLVNWVIYTLMTNVLGMETHPQGSAQYLLIGNIANVVAWVLSVLFAFFTNKRYVFKSDKTRHNGAWKEFILFVSARIASYLIFDLALFTLLLSVFHVHHQVAKILMNVLVIVFNYVASKIVIFKKNK